ncbi:Cleavage and polyadenylation specificity factor subunit 1 [Quaeritorhiza haematococci]|nr:Cleavage and polyadenylation specificity factor subunit 1 [Quaeritorhiza haematococci]
MNLLLQDMQFPKIQPLWQSTTSQGVSKVARLELLAQIKLQGNITCMEPVRTSTSVGLLGMDSLLLSFSDAKMSLVEWSQACQNIVTVSIHFYEREEFKKESLTDKWIPTIRVDPQFRCATLSFYNDRLAVLPFKQDAGVGAVAGGDVEEDITSKYPFTPSFVISMATIDPKIRNVIDTAFLYDFFEPTLAILYETTQTWTGRLESKRDTKSVAVVSMDVTQKNFAILYVVDNLPYDCFKLVPVPSPVGGLLVFSTRGIIHVDQTSIPGVACAVNGYYGIETEIPPPPPPAPSADGTVVRSSAAESPKKDNPLYSKSNVSDYKHLGISLTGCMHLFLNPDTLLLILQTGEMLILELEGQDGVGSSWKRRKAGVRRFKMHRLGLRAMMPYCGTRVGGLDLRANSGQKTWARVLGGLGGLGGSQGAGAGVTDYGYLFIGSRIADSLLLQYSELHPRKLNKIVNGDGGDGAEQTEEKGRILSSFMDDEMEDIYRDGFTLSANDGLRSDSAAGGMVGAGSSPFRFRFRVCDTVICMGPIRDMAVGEPASQYSDFPFQPSTQRKDLEIVACIGEGPDGSLGIFQRNVRPQILSSFEIPDVTDMWTIRCVGTSTNAEVNAGEKTDDDGVYHKYLILSSGSGTMVGDKQIYLHRPITPIILKLFSVGARYNVDTQTMPHPCQVLETGAELQEIEGTDLYRETPTVAAGTVLNESLVLQVHPNGILVLDSNLELIQVVDVGEEERWIVSCHIMDPYILLLMNVGDVMLYVADSSRTLRLCKEVKDAPISACCIYRDDAESQCFMTISEAKRYFQQSRRTIVTRGKSKSSQKGKGTGSSSSADMDDEDAVVLVRNPKKKSKKPKRRRENVGPDVMDMDVDQVDLDLYGAGDDDDDGDLYGMSTDEEEDEAEITLMDEDKSAPNGAEASEPSAPVDGVDVNNEKSNKTVESVPGTESVHIAGDGTEVTEENVSRVGVDGIGMLWTDRRYFCAIYWEDGSLGIYRIPDFQQCFFFPRFDLLPNLLVDQQPNNQTNEKPVNADGTASAVQQPEFDFNEILMTNIGRDESHRDAYLMARTEVGDLIIYRAFVYADVLPMRTPVTPLTKSKSADATGVQSISGPATFQDRLAIRFVRVQHDHLSREPQTYKDTEGDKLNPVASRSRRQPTFLKRHYLRPFTDIGTDAEGGGAGILYSGVFMGGFRPCWIMAAGTGVLGPQLEVFEEDEAELDEQQLDGGFAGGRRNANDLLEPSLPLAGKRTVRIHPAIADGEILSFSPFHNVNCPHGFMYINHQGSLRICRLLPQFMYDAEWPFCRVRLRRIPQKITYHHSSETYVVATSVPVPFVLARAQHAAAVAAGVIEEGDESAANLPTGYEDRRMYISVQSFIILMFAIG